jgi:hypothetical protein
MMCKHVNSNKLWSRGGHQFLLGMEFQRKVAGKILAAAK